MSEQKPLIGTATEKLSAGRKLAFAVGTLPAAITNTVVGFFLTAFLLEVAAVPPSFASAILFAGRAWDAVTDPIVGYSITRTHTRWGQLKPWIGGALGPCAACYLLMWMVPDTGTTGKVVYYLAFYLGFQTFYSCYHVPYTSLTVHLSPHAAERDSATSFRMIFEVLAVLIGSVLQGAIISNSNDDECKSCDPNADDGDPLADEKKNYVVAAVIITIIMVICGAILLFFVPEDRTGHSQHESFFKVFRFAMRARSYRYLTMSFLWVWMAVAMVQANYILWIKYVIDRNDHFQNFLIILLLFTFASVPIWYMIMNKMGKKATFGIGVILCIPNFLVSFVVPADVSTAAMYVGSAYGGFCISCVYLLPWAMLPDVIDETELETGVRREAVFYSYFVFFQKLGAGVAIGLSTMALSNAGYISDPCCGEVQPDSVANTLRFSQGIIPIILSAFSLGFLYMYPIDFERQMELKAMKTEHLSGNGKRQDDSMSLKSTRTRTVEVDPVNQSTESTA
eukprot:m.139276 g.139276  ORF g.139276 m.139276 type:complete len:509 (+) comp20302_c0_seq1:56-1582(+)